MDYNEVAQLVGTLGFPIIACCALFWMLNTTLKENTESNRNITTAILELTTYIKSKEGDA